MIVFLSLLLLFQSPPGFRNLDFERGKVGKAPPGWQSDLEGYGIYLTDTGAKGGSYCGVVARKKTQSSSTYGTLSQVVNAKPFRGKRVVFRSFVRTEPHIASNRAFLFAAVYRENGDRAVYNDNDGQSIRNEEWREFEISVDVCTDAATLYFGLSLQGEGRAFWDEIRAEVIEVSDRANERPKAMEGRAVENVVAFARLLGYLRYFYPGDEATKTNWDRFAIDGIRIVEPAKDPESLAELMEAWCHPVAPAVRVFPTSKSKEALASFSLPKDGAIGKIFWKYQGAPGGMVEADCFRAERIHAFFDRKDLDIEHAPDPEKSYVADLGGGVSCLVPVALYESALGPLPQGSSRPPMQPPPRPPGFAPSGNDRATRLAAVALAWNVFQHFYPYFEVVEADWIGALVNALQRAAVDPDERAFLRTLRLMVVQLQDGHGRVVLLKDNSQFVPPIVWKWVEEQLVVTKVGGGADLNVEVGDVVTSIDGRPTPEALESVEKVIGSATPQRRRSRGVEYLLDGPPNSALLVEIQSPKGKTKSAKLARTTLKGSMEWQRLREPAIETLTFLKPDIVYVDLGRISTDEFVQALPKLAEAKGIVFDLREYPWKINEVFLLHLIEKPAPVSRAHMPIVLFPDRMNFSFTDDLDKPIEPKEPRLRAKAVFLAEGGTISMAETYLMIVEGNRLGEIVGSPTAGTDGVTHSFIVPGDYKITWTAMKMLKRDGSRLHGIGVLPTVPERPTLQGILEGRDELVEKAVEILAK